MFLDDPAAYIVHDKSNRIFYLHKGTLFLVRQWVGKKWMGQKTTSLDLLQYWNWEWTCRSDKLYRARLCLS